MSVAESWLPEWDAEMAATRRVLERVPSDKLEWQPHDKSYTVRQLAGHLSQMPGWTGMTLNAPELDVNPPGGADWPQPEIGSTEDILALFDQNQAQGREVLAGAADSVFAEDWAFKNAGETLWSAPKGSVLRRFVLNHMIHHRAQLTVYLRLLDVPLPQVFGPTADEPGM